MDNDAEFRNKVIETITDLQNLPKFNYPNLKCGKKFHSEFIIWWKINEPISEILPIPFTEGFFHIPPGIKVVLDETMPDDLAMIGNKFLKLK